MALFCLKHEASLKADVFNPFYLGICFAYLRTSTFSQASSSTYCHKKMTYPTKAKLGQNEILHKWLLECTEKDAQTTNKQKQN